MAALVELAQRARSLKVVGKKNPISFKNRLIYV